MRRAVAAAMLAALAACTSSPSQHPSGSAGGASSPSSGPVRLIGPSASAALKRLCTLPPLHEHRAKQAAHVPDIVTETEHEVESVRGLHYLHPVAVDAVTGWIQNTG